MAKIQGLLASGFGLWMMVSSVPSLADVPMASCVLGNPTVTLAPPTQGGIAGSKLTYLVSVLDNDNTVCPAAVYHLSAVFPSGFSGSLSAHSLTLTSGTTEFVTLSVTSPAGAPVGTSTLSVTAVNSVSTGFASTVSATDTVTPVCVSANPVVTIIPQNQASQAGSTLTYILAVQDKDSPSCSNATFVLTVSMPSQLTGTLGTQAVTLAPGASASTIITVASLSSVPSGVYTFSASATNAATSSLSGTVTATNTIGISCILKNPTVTLLPSSQSGQIGETLTYTVSATNNDSPLCGSSAFTWVLTLPAGFGGVASVPSLSLAPGETESFSLIVTPAASVPLGSYPIAVQAVHSGSTAYKGVGQGTYSVTNMAVYVKSKPFYARPQIGNLPSIAIHVFVSSGFTAVSNATVNLSISAPDGSIISSQSTTDDWGKATFYLPLSATMPSGIYSENATVTTGGVTAVGVGTFEMK